MKVRLAQVRSVPGSVGPRALAVVCVSALAVTAFVGLVGCDAPGLSRKAKAPTASARAAGLGETTTTSADVNANAAPAGPDTFALKTPGVAVSDAISVACGIAPRDPRKPHAPSFDFDSAALTEEDRVALGQVARCLADGALKGRAVTLTGRADARGEPEYNMTLGESRSDSVKRYMVDLGVGRERMRATSRGEIDAVGKDEAGWAEDRRVDIELVP